MKNLMLSLVLLFSTTITFSQNKFQKTLSKTDSIEALGSFKNIDWLTGHWRGEAFGGIVEEIWSQPEAGTMMFSFRLIKNNEIGFYEFGFIQQKGNSLVLKLKHFNNDLTGWEEKDKWVEFPLVKQDQNTTWFDGFTIEKVNDNEINMYVRIGNEGEVKEAHFNYRKFSNNSGL